MFEQQQHVANLASLAQIDQLSLRAKAFGIIELAELDDRDHVTAEIIGPQGSAGVFRLSRVGLALMLAISNGDFNSPHTVEAEGDGAAPECRP